MNKAVTETYIKTDESEQGLRLMRSVDLVQYDRPCPEWARHKEEDYY